MKQKRIINQENTSYHSRTDRSDFISREEFIMGVANNLPGLVFQLIVNRDGTYAFPFVGDQAGKILGLPPETTDFFKWFVEHVPPEEKNQFLDSVNLAISRQKPWDYEGRFIKPDGLTIYFRGQSTPIDNDGIVTFNGIIFDITTSRQQEDSYIEKQATLQAILDNPLVAVILADKEGRIVEWNQVFTRYTGLSKEEVQNLTVWDLPNQMIPDQEKGFIKKQIEEKYRKSFETGILQFPPTGIFPMEMPDGQRLTVQQHMFMINTRKGLFWGALIIDITEQEKARQSLSDSERVYKAIFNQSPNEISLSKMNGEIIDVNEKFCQVMGLKRDEVLGKTSQGLGRFTQEQIIEMRSVYEKTGGVVDFFEITSQINGIERTVLLNGRTINLHDQLVALTVITDISDRKKTEEKVRLQLQKIQGLRDIDLCIIEGAELGYTLQVILQHAVKTLNVDSAYLSLFKQGTYDISESLFEGDRLAGWEELDFSERPGLKAIEFGKTIVLSSKELDAVFYKKNSLKASCATPIIINGVIKGVMEVFLRQDEVIQENDWFDYFETLVDQVVIAISHSELIEEQKKNEIQIRQNNAELEIKVRDRTAALSVANQELEAFTYSVSHDLRSPLRTMAGFASILLEEYQNKIDGQGLHYLSSIKEASGKMDQLIIDLLNLSRITRIDFIVENVNLSNMVSEAMSEIIKESDHRTVKLIIEPNIEANCCKSLMKIALTNLLENAYKFTKNREKTIIEFGMQESRNKKVLFVRDNGAGFSMKFISHLFEPFHRLHETNEFPGTGIGLTIVQRVIKRHGGEIWPESEEGKGTTFYFTL